ncbi:MAG: D-amino acid aminotransferase [Burkholderiales bacterium]|nr:MAG: D-amino acid aminotransferase [Burkholderiales bacterium]
MEPIVYLNGNWLPLAEAHVPVLDRGFIFGDGIYEVVPVYRAVPFRWLQHLARLERSLAEVRIDDPLGPEAWTAMVYELVDRQDAPDQFVYMQVTRGVARRDHAFPAAATPTVFAMSTPFPGVPTEQREHGVAAITLPDERWLRCHIKSTSLLGNVLARQQAVDAGAVECVMFRDGRLTEGAASNIWVVRDGIVMTPPRSHLILAGIRIGLVEELCLQADVPLAVRPVERIEVDSADELMLTSATKELIPIVSLDGRPVGSGSPGPMYRRLRAAYDAAVEASVARGRMAPAAVASAIADGVRA